METIKIGKRIFEIKKGDYILDNKACFQFCARDRRKLYGRGFERYSNIVIPKSVMAKIDLNTFIKVPYGKNGIADGYYAYIFPEPVKRTKFRDNEN